MVRVNIVNKDLLYSQKLRLAGTKSGIALLILVNSLNGSINKNVNPFSVNNEIQKQTVLYLNLDLAHLEDNKIIDFNKAKSNSKFNKQVQEIQLLDWIKVFHDDKELRAVFINMDLAMKYIHGKGYCIHSFDPKDIKILNNSLNQIKYEKLLKMPNEYNDQRELIKEDIYSSAFLQIGIYTKCLDYMKPKVLSDNFDGFAIFLPESDVPYYKGVVNRGASVYLSEYVVEKKKRDLQALEQEVHSSGANNEKGKNLVKSNGYHLSNDAILNQNIRENDYIYAPLDNRKEAAFISFVACLSISFLVGFIVLFMVFVLNVF